MTMFLNTKSLLHTLNPRFKVLFFLILLILLFFINTWVGIFICLFFLLILVLISKIPFLLFISRLKIPILMFVFMFIIQLLLMPNISNGYEDLFFAFMRLINLVILVYILLLTTSISTLLLIFENSLKPLQKIGLKTGAWVLVFKMISRFVPSLFIEAHIILKAQASRGLDIKTAPLVKKLSLIGALLLPVFVAAIKRTDEMANSMAVRGFVLNQKRTHFQVVKDELSQNETN